MFRFANGSELIISSDMCSHDIAFQNVANAMFPSGMAFNQNHFGNVCLSCVPS